MSAPRHAAARDVGTTDRRDLVAAVLVGTAGVLVLLAWLASLVLAGPVVGTTRTALMVATAPPVVVQLAAHLLAAVALLRPPGTVGRVLTVALGATGAVTLVASGLAALGPDRLVITVPVALSVGRAFGDLAAAAVVVTRWQETGPPALVAPRTGARAVILGVGLAGAVLGLLPQLTSDVSGTARLPLSLPVGEHVTVTATTLAGLAVSIALVVAAASLAHRPAAAVLAGYAAGSMLALSIANLAGSRAFRLTAHTTAWWWLVIATHATVVVAAVVLWRGDPAQVSSDTA